MTVTVKHSKTNAISDWTQAQLDEQIELGNFAPGTTLADIVLPSDWNNDHTLTGVGTMAEQDANTVAITGGTINNTTIGASTASTGVFTTLTVNNTTGTSLANIWSNTNTSPIADLQFTRGTTSTWGGDAFTDYKLRASGGNFIVQSQNNATAVLDLLTFDEANNAVKFSPGGIEQARVSRTASAVNYVQVTGAATGAGNFPTISAQGSDANVNLRLAAKGSANIDFQIGGTTRTSIDSSGVFRAGIAANGTAGFQVTVTGSQANFFSTTGAVAGIVPSLLAQGSDTNISMAFQPKGTGAINLAAGSRGVNISNGGTVTAITRTNAGSGYTSFPTPVISAPTTAGGVQAVATVGSMLAGNPTTIQSGGTGYTVNDTLTIVGGTPTASSATYTVTAVSGGVVTAVTALNFAQYTALPTNPVSVTGGTGTGCTLNVTYGLGTSPSFNISNAGSGYIEQPTVTFSGGGGSGAAAYATVGSGTIVRSLGNTLSFTTPGGEQVRINDSGATAVNYWQLQGRSTAGGVLLSAQGSDANIAAFMTTKGTGSLSFTTNNFAQEQLRVAHTASAVNYVQVTGSATGGIPAITAQGSDANTPLSLWSKNTGSIFFYTSGGSAQFEITATASAVNRIQATGAIAGASPRLTSAGSDTNINLTLTPKGTGRVQFGTYTATVSTIAGYIEILDSGGTVRRLAVVS